MFAGRDIRPCPRFSAVAYLMLEQIRRSLLRHGTSEQQMRTAAKWMSDRIDFLRILHTLQIPGVWFVYPPISIGLT